MNLSHYAKLITNSVRYDTVATRKDGYKVSGFDSGCYLDDGHLDFYTM